MKKLAVILIAIILLPLPDRAGNNKIPDVDGYEAVYSALHLGEMGLSNQAFHFALLGFERLKKEGKLFNQSVLTIIDFSQSSTKKRLYVIDLYKKVLLFNTYVAHGRNTGDEFAEKFSNIPGTFQSSLGFYLTENMSVGPKVGLSLLLKGIEKGINDRAREREIIIHGADYATEDFIKKTGRLGRSYGCPSLPPDLVKPVAEIIKDGSLLFIYATDKSYLQKSQVLN